MTSLKFYYDFLSQPCRAVGLLLESAQVEHEKCFLNIVKGRFCVTISLLMSIANVNLINCRTTKVRRLCQSLSSKAGSIH